MTAPVATAESASRIASALSSPPAVGSKATIAARPDCSDTVGSTCTAFALCSAACSALMITFELFGRTMTLPAAASSTAARISAVAGFIVRPPSTIRAPRLSNRRRLPSPATTATTSVANGSDGAGTAAQEPRLALLGLRVHVRDLDPLDGAGCDADRERAARVVGVHVHLQRGRVADDEQRVAQLLELRLDRVGVEPLALDHEDRAVAEAGELLVDRLDRDRVVVGGRLRQRLAGDGRGDPAHDLDEPGRARVDDAGLPEDVEQLGRPEDAVVAALDQVPEQLDGRLPAPRLGLVGQLADRGQHRPLDRLADGAVGRVGRAPDGARQVGALAERVGGAADDLREDDARVAARAHQRRAGDLVRERGAVGRGRALERLRDRAHGQRQVRAGVAVRHRIDVQVVDPAAVRLHRGEGRPGQAARELEVALRGHPSDRRALSMWTSTAATGIPVSRSSS